MLAIIEMTWIIWLGESRQMLAGPDGKHKMSDISTMKSRPLKPEFIQHAESAPQTERNKAARKYHRDFAVL